MPWTTLAGGPGVTRTSAWHSDPIHPCTAPGGAFLCSFPVTDPIPSQAIPTAPPPALAPAEAAALERKEKRAAIIVWDAGGRGGGWDGAELRGTSSHSTQFPQLWHQPSTPRCCCCCCPRARAALRIPGGSAWGARSGPPAAASPPGGQLGRMRVWLWEDKLSLVPGASSRQGERSSPSAQPSPACPPRSPAPPYVPWKSCHKLWAGGGLANFPDFK